MSINTSTGLFSADTALGNYVVKANSGAIDGTTVVTIVAGGGTGGNGADGIITTAAGTTYQVMDGFGTSQRMFDDPHINGQSPTASTGGMIVPAAAQNEILTKLYSETLGIGLNRFRSHPGKDGWQTTDGGPFTYDTAYPGPQGTKERDYIAKIVAINPNLKFWIQIGQYDAWVRTATVAKTAA